MTLWVANQVHSWKKWEVEAINEGGTTVDEGIVSTHCAKYIPELGFALIYCKMDRTPFIDRDMMVAALNPKHIKLDPGQKFAEGRIRYEFLRTSRTGLNLDSYVVSLASQAIPDQG